jgi:hypothetical protein
MNNGSMASKEEEKIGMHPINLNCRVNENSVDAFFNTPMRRVEDCS